MLDVKTDPAVQDCKELFMRTMEENCKKTVDVQVKYAQVRIIDGLEVDMEVNVCKPGSDSSTDCHVHTPQCAFECSKNHEDAQLLQRSTRNETHTVHLEDKGLYATLRLFTSLCDADSTDGTHTSGMHDAPDANMWQRVIKCFFA